MQDIHTPFVLFVSIMPNQRNVLTVAIIIDILTSVKQQRSYKQLYEDEQGCYHYL